MVLVEGVALLGFAAAEVLANDGASLAATLSNAVFFLLYAAGLDLSAWGLARLRSWSRGPVVLAQLIQLGVAWSFYGNDTVGVAVVLAATAVAVLLVVLSPSTSEQLFGVREASESGP